MKAAIRSSCSCGHGSTCTPMAAVKADQQEHSSGPHSRRAQMHVNAIPRVQDRTCDLLLLWPQTECPRPEKSERVESHVPSMCASRWRASEADGASYPYS